MPEIGEHGPATDALVHWDNAQRNLAEAEIAVIKWQLKSSGPVPGALEDSVRKCKEAVTFFEEWALVHLQDGWRERKPVDVYRFGVHARM
jgi:hypothetical protein